MVSSKWLSQLLLLSSYLVISSTPVLSTVFQSTSDLGTKNFDFVIVGGKSPTVPVRLETVRS